MTRKRYIKLLMAKGFSRNEANTAAQMVVEEGDTYLNDYAMFLLHDSAPYTTELAAITEAMSRITDTIANITRALAAAFRAFGDAYRAAMDGEEGGRT